MKCSLCISNFLEETSSLSYSITFLYFFALITEEGSLTSPWYALELCIQTGISFLFSFAFQFSRSVVSNSLRPHESQHARPPCPSPIPWSLPKSMPIESVMPFSHLILCHPILLLPPIPPSIRVFSNVNSLHEVAKVLELQLQHQSSQWTPRTDLL